MSQVHEILLLIFLIPISTHSFNISSCIPDTPCQCYLTKYSFTLTNCSNTLSDLPIFNSKNTNNITRIIARQAFIQWPIQLCQYSNIQILDLSGSNFSSQTLNLSCLSHLIHLNLSNSQLNYIPTFQTNYLQILDLSNNNIKRIDGAKFRSLNNLISLFLQNNPLKYLEHLEDFFGLPTIESINLLSTNSTVILKETLTRNQWIDLGNQWENSTKSFLIRMDTIPFQSIIRSDQFRTISIDTMKIIVKMLINSTFFTSSNTPKCNCIQLRTYQRLFSLVEYQKKYTSPLFQSVKCLMRDGITNARLFDRLTYIDLRCPSLGKISLFPLLTSSSSTLNQTFLSFFIISLFLLY